jgi:hypothetical protein
MSGQYPAGFPTELVLFQNLAPISGGSITDKMGHLHLIAQFLPEASVSDVFNTYRTKLPTMGWTITTSGSVGTSTKNILLYLNASKGTETLGLTVQTIKTGTQMRLEVIQ